MNTQQLTTIVKVSLPARDDVGCVDSSLTLRVTTSLALRMNWLCTNCYTDLGSWFQRFARMITHDSCNLSTKATFDSRNSLRLRTSTWRVAISAMRSWLLVSMIIGIPMQTGLGQTESRELSQAPSLRADIPFDFENSIHRVYGTEQGLPSNWIQTVLQTSDGFLWVGTHNGLARFDGVNFISYQRPRLPANDCRELLESRDGTLWIGTTGGLAKYRRGCPGSFEQIDELAQQSIRAIFEDSSGRIWVGTSRKTWRSNGSKFEPLDDAPNGVRSIIEDGSNIWLGSDNGLYEDCGLYRNIPLADNVPEATKITAAVT